MPNVFDYLDWRGDLSFSDVPCCEVDNLIFSLLSYLDFSGLLLEGGFTDVLVCYSIKNFMTDKNLAFLN